MQRTVKLLTTKGDGKFIEVDWVKPEIKDNEIEVKAVMTGVCRSDIDMMNGQFNLPMEMHGHEGLGVVTQIGSSVVTNVVVGDFVATRGEPAYADFYNAADGTFVKVPRLEPKYIIEPIACGINLFRSLYKSRISVYADFCIIGTGFLASIIYQNLKGAGIKKIDVIGNHNKAHWLFNHAVEVQTTTNKKYDVVFDLSNKDIAFTQDMYNPEALLIMGAAKHPSISTTFDYCLWNGIRIECPSPRNHDFINCMEIAVEQIQNGNLNIDNFWTKGYNRHTDEWRLAFIDSLDRQPGFNRAYIYW